MRCASFLMYSFFPGVSENPHYHVTRYQCISTRLDHTFADTKAAYLTFFTDIGVRRVPYNKISGLDMSNNFFKLIYSAIHPVTLIWENHHGIFLAWFFSQIRSEV